MMRHASLLCSLLVLAGCETRSSYRVIRVTLDEVSEPLACRVVVPSSLAEHAPLVIAYHGVGDTPEAMAGYSQLDQLAAEQRFVLVYPHAQGKLWQVPRANAPSQDTSRDLQRFDKIVQKMKQQYAIDLDRVYVVGMSQGGTFVQFLVTQRPKQIAAAVAHSGASSEATDSARGQPPLLLIAGHEDPVHDAVQAAASDYQSAGSASEFISVSGLGHQWSPSHNDAIWEFLKERRR